MKSLISSLIGLVLVVVASAEPLIEGQVRLDSGEPVAEAQVQIFDMTDLQRGAIARALTDGTGYFALPLAALTGRALPERLAPKRTCGVGQQREPIYVIDPQGRIVRTLHR